MSILAKTEIKVEFKAMGTEFEIVCAAQDLYLLKDLENYAHRLEQLWTRFSDSSELMQLNLNTGTPLHISTETAQLVAEMRRGYFMTAGLFNAGVLPAMYALGFGSATSQFEPNELTASNFHELWKSVIVDENSVCLPQGLAIDAGGIGKGLAADLIAQRAMQLRAQGIVVNAGGEVAVHGKSANPAGWSVGVENPFDENEQLTAVFLTSGGLATSAPSGWTKEGNSHIVDPRTGHSINSPIAQATVLSARAVDAEILAKMCLLMPIDEGLAKVDQLGAAAFLVDNELNTYTSENWGDFE